MSHEIFRTPGIKRRFSQLSKRNWESFEDKAAH
jgi:hypothetical protein